MRLSEFRKQILETWREAKDLNDQQMLKMITADFAHLRATIVSDDEVKFAEVMTLKDSKDVRPQMVKKLEKIVANFKQMRDSILTVRAAEAIT